MRLCLMESVSMNLARLLKKMFTNMYSTIWIMFNVINGIEKKKRRKMHDGTKLVSGKRERRYRDDDFQILMVIFFVHVGNFPAFEWRKLDPSVSNREILSSNLTPPDHVHVTFDERFVHALALPSSPWTLTYFMCDQSNWYLPQEQ
ncbi:10776_t:CDS:2 [Acaulospora morrowiae]|uniref:10776_t:CDS:1 n=1 Tax=Acaulospora morrowiae TaxID=94023 RepID=A0A9N8WCY2_9GLOM|nr:10776_t:CDS:2 [Acaulospora morrowiae]